MSYHKERLAHVTEEVQNLLEQKEASERRLHELAAVHERESHVTAEEHAAEPVAETESESLHLTDDGVILEEEHAHETEAVVEDDEEAAETEHEPDAESETETIHTTVEPEGAYHLQGETVVDEAETGNIDEPVSEHGATAETTPIASAEYEETTHEPVAEHTAEDKEPVTVQEPHKGSFPA